MTVEHVPDFVAEAQREAEPPRRARRARSRAGRGAAGAPPVPAPEPPRERGREPPASRLCPSRRRVSTTRRRATRRPTSR